MRVKKLSVETGESRWLTESEGEANDAAGDDGREPDVDDANEASKPAGIKSRGQIQELLHDRMEKQTVNVASPGMEEEISEGTPREQVASREGV